MARPQKVTDAQIARVARDAFLELGPGISVDVVAKRLGVSHAALFHRVGSKERLMASALSPERPAALDVLRASPDPDVPIRRQLSDVLVSLMGHFSGLVPALVVLRAAGRPVGQEAQGETPPPVEMRAQLARWLTRANKLGLCQVAAPGAVAEALLGALEARCFNAYVGGEAFVTGSDRAFIRKLIKGLVPEKREER